MDFSKRLESVELMVNEVLRLLQQKSKPPRPGSPDTSQEDPIISHLDGLSKSVVQLREDFERLKSSDRKARERAENAHRDANEMSLAADGATCNVPSLPRHDTRGDPGGRDLLSTPKDGARNADAVTINDMGYGLIERLGRYGPDFSGKIHVSGFASFDLARISNRLADPYSPASLTVQHSSTSTNGVSELFLARKAGFKFPDFSNLPQTAPPNYEKSFETVIASTPRKPISYYVGPPLTPDFNTLLSPGKLVDLGEIPGVTTHYWHAGEKDSGTAFHYEDGAVRSCNVTITGFKLWILINVSSHTKFEDYIQSLRPSAAKLPRCGQWLRHLNILISPQKLTEMNIGFDLVLAGPGDMVVTKPGQYHAVLNLTACFAIAINFALPDDPVLEPTVVCPKCGLYELNHPALQQLEVEVSLNEVRRGRRAKRQAENGILEQPARVRPDHQPSTDAASPGDATANEDASASEAQADEIAVGTGSRLDADEEDTTIDCDREQAWQLSNGSAVGSPPALHHSSTSPCPPSAAASSLSPPSSSVACLTTPSNSILAAPFTPTLSLDHSLSTGETSHIRRSPTVESELPCHLSASPTSSTVCEQTSPLTRTGTTKRRLSHEDIAKRSRLCLQSTDTTIIEELLDADQQCNVPRFDRITPPDTRILRLATAVRSRYAVRQFYDLVNAKRNLQLQNIFFPTYNRANVARRLVILDGLKYSKTITHLNQYLFAVDIEKRRNGALRVPPCVKEYVLQASGLSDSQYKHHLQAGNKWREICGEFEGILCFILSDKHNPFQVSAATYYDLKDHELQLFHHLLADDYTKAICTAGKAFQQSLNTNDSYFSWETSKLSSPLHELPEDAMLSYIQPVSSLLENKHCAAEFPDWPDPTLISPTEKQCDYCSSRSCDCYISKAPNVKPRVMVYPGKGLGLQATSEEPGGIVYQRYELIGFLTGKLIPPGTLDNDRVVDFHKCQIDCSDEGNEFRLMNHACATHAVARLAKKRVSGRIRQSVVALRNINNGAEITITYSEDHKHPCDGCKDESIPSQPAATG